MGADFVVDRLAPGLLYIWLGGSVVLIVVYDWHWRRYRDLYTRRHDATDLRAQLRILEDSRLREVQADPEVDLLRRKARRNMGYAVIWSFALLPLTVVLFALAFASGPSR
jgi:hypothetical protein